MELEQEVRKMVKQIVMEEINNLSIRATIREKIEDAGFDHFEIRRLVREIADSYFRSAMNGDVEYEIRKIFNEKVTERVEKEIKAVIGESWHEWRGKKNVADALLKEVDRRIDAGFDIKISIKQKGEQ